MELMIKVFECRSCGSQFSKTLVDLGNMPVANSLVELSNQHLEEKTYPLEVRICNDCEFFQLSVSLEPSELFPPGYVYHSSYSSTWIEQCKNFTDEIIADLNLSKDSMVLEIASNDGYLLQYFKERGVKVLGIEPAIEASKVAIDKGIETIQEFFSLEVAKNLNSRGIKPSLICGNNVLAHVPNLLDFMLGVSHLLENGIATFEFPHVLNLLRNSQFDTIYHEHYSYLSISALLPFLEKCGLRIFRIKKLTSHGGSLRIYVCRSKSRQLNDLSVDEILREEISFGLSSPNSIEQFSRATLRIKDELVDEIKKIQRDNKSIAAYGAAAKGVTLLNYSKLTSKEIKFVVDLNPEKQGKFLPGSRIPIVNLKYLQDHPVDILLILPWNIAGEIREQLSNELPKTKFLRAVPKVEYI